jgi:hypothetical protein
VQVRSPLLADICIDFDPGAAGDGVGQLRDGCKGTDLQVDRDWAANPNSDTAPCCANTSVIFASLVLTSLAEGSGSATRSFDWLMEKYQVRAHTLEG